MDHLSYKEALREQAFGNGFAFSLPAGGKTDLTALQAAQHFAGTLLLPLVRLRWNGQEQILYLPGSSRPFPEAAAALDDFSFLRLAAGLLHSLEQCSETGFFDCSGFLLKPERLYLGPGNRPLPVFLPAAGLPVLSPQEFRAQVKELLCRMQDMLPACSCTSERETARGLFFRMAEGSLSFGNTAEELLRLAGEKRASRGSSGKETDAGEKNGPRGRLLLCPLSGEDRNALEPERFPCILGKAEGGADLRLSGRLVSRRHCRITENGGKFFVCDLESTNGTFLNGRRLPAGLPVSLGNGDILKLAVSEYRIMLRGEGAQV